MPRRRIFDSQYGSAKGEASKGGSQLPPPQGTPPVPLPLRAAPPTPMSDGQGAPIPIEQLLQQLLARFGGVNGPSA